MKPGTETIRRLLDFQRNEITEYHIYRKLARKVTSPENRRVMEAIAGDELRHYRTRHTYTGQDVAPDRSIFSLSSERLHTIEECEQVIVDG